MGLARDAIWAESLERIASPRGERGGVLLLLQLEQFPALLLVYGAGMSRIAAEEYGNLAALLTRVRTGEHGRQEEAVKVLRCPLGEGLSWNFLPGRAQELTPLNNLVFEFVRDLVRDVFRDDERYEQAFDKYEYLAALIHHDFEMEADPESGPRWSPIGRFAWRNRRFRLPIIMEAVQRELEKKGADWGPIQAGLFGGSADRASNVKRAYDQWMVGATVSWGV
jgi:hypothetical protein